MSKQPQAENVFANLPAEQLCSLLRVDNRSYDWLEDLKPSVWDDLVSNAIWFGLGVVCYLHLQEIEKLDKLPPKTLNKLRNNYLKSCATSLLRERELNHIIQQFIAADIHVVLLKGAHLAEVVYQNPSLRQMLDLDLMVRKEQLNESVQLLMHLGYQPSKLFWSDFETTISHQLPAFVKPNHFPVELHWTIILPSLPFQVDLDGLWDRARAYQFSGSERWGLSLEDLILHLAIHTVIQHQLIGGLRQIYDLAKTIMVFKDKIQWSILADRADQWRAKSTLYLALNLSNNLFGAECPENFAKLIKPDNFTQAWMENARDLLLFNQQRFPSFSRNLAFMLEAKNSRDKINIFLGRIFLPPKEMAEVYPVRPDSFRLWFYYPVHFINLVMKHLHSMLGYLKRDRQIINSLRTASLLQDREDYINEQLMN